MSELYEFEAVVTVVSDLHLERTAYSDVCEAFGADEEILLRDPDDHDARVVVCRQVTDLDGVDIILLAGDISTTGDSGWWALAFADAYPEAEVVMVLGNHDYWHARPGDVEEEVGSGISAGSHVRAVPPWYRWAKGEAEPDQPPADQPLTVRHAADRVHILRHQTVEVLGVRIFGSSLWFPESPTTERAAQRCAWADFRCVEFPTFAGGWMDSGESSSQDYRAAARWVYGQNWLARRALERALAEGPPPQIIMTHHLPSLDCVHPRWRNTGPQAEDDLNDFFVGGDTELVEQAAQAGVQAWVFGHTHDSVDLRQEEDAVNGMALIANPRGYQPPTGRPAFEHERLNPTYDPKGRRFTIKTRGEEE